MLSAGIIPAKCCIVDGLPAGWALGLLIAVQRSPAVMHSPSVAASCFVYPCGRGHTKFPCLLCVLQCCQGL